MKAPNAVNRSPARGPVYGDGLSPPQIVAPAAPSSTGNVVTIIVKPVSSIEFEARCGGVLLVRHSTPFLSAARKLLEMGYSRDATLLMRHEGSNVVALQGKIGWAAGRAIKNLKSGPTVLRKWKPPQRDPIQSLTSRGADSQPTHGTRPKRSGNG